MILPKKHRTIDPSISVNIDTTNYSLLTKRCIENYLANWHILHYKYITYSGSYLQFSSK